ncbi:MAG: molybdenum ABC transporter permease [Bacteroidetes bacterium]|nr:molybdenum ABC transporter permease [Bacteroidota bacterium]
MTRTDPFALVLTFLGGLVLLFIIAPLLSMFFGTPLNDVFATAGEKEVLDSIWLTLVASFGGTLFFAFLVIPLAYILARKDFPGKRIVNGIIDIPIVIPHTAAGIAVLGFVSRDTAIGQVASSLGFEFVGHPTGIALAMAFVSVPFLINAARDGFSAVPVRLEQAAYNLGANPFRVFFTISIPLAWRHILSGFIMMFARGLSEFGAVVIIAYHPITAPVMIYERFTSFGLKYAKPVAVIFILVCLVFFLLLRMLTRAKKETVVKNTSVKNIQ